MSELNKIRLEIQISNSIGIFNLMKYLQDLGESKNFEELQKILDECDMNEWGDGTGLVTILIVTRWYGKHLNRKSFYEKVYRYFIDVVGHSEEKTFNMLKGLRDTWSPTFGFERELFGINE